MRGRPRTRSTKRGRQSILTWTMVTMAPSRCSNSASCRVWFAMPPAAAAAARPVRSSGLAASSCTRRKRSENGPIPGDARRPVALALDERAAPARSKCGQRSASLSSRTIASESDPASSARNKTPVSPSSDQLLVSTYVGGDQQPSLRHRLQRFQRGHKLGKAHRMPWIGENVDDAVIALHFPVRHASGEDDFVRDAEAPRLRLERRFLRAAADKQRTRRGHARSSRWQRREQQVKAFIRVERADEADDRCSRRARARP